jgi:hypothetical protein
MSTPSKRKLYRTVDDAALGGFRKILQSYPHWIRKEYGFFVFGVKYEVLNRVGSGGFYSDEKRYFYTEPYTDGRPDKISLRFTLNDFTRDALRAFCHTHKDSGGFSGSLEGQDLWMFRRMKELTEEDKLKHDIAFYLLNFDREVRRARAERDFTQGERIKGLDRAIP